MMQKIFAAATMLILIGLGLPACTTTHGSSTAPAATTDQSGGGY